MMDEKRKMDNPKLAVMIALKAKKKMMDKEGGGDDMYSDIAGDVIQAVKADDSEGLAEALKAFVEACGSKSSGDSDEEDKEAY